jgi:predicted MFS family arabinose efflux permease
MSAQTAVAERRPVATALRVFLPFALGYFLSYLYRVVNAVIAPDLIADVGLDAATLGLLTSTYFLSFGLFQLPLGILLDRFGPRRTEATLLLCAAFGALVFASAGSATGLTLGRACIGLGASACLMAAFKAFVLWFPSERLPLVNGLQMAAGGFGALAGTAPVEAVLKLTGWRGVFVVLAACTLAVALTIFVAVPERVGQQAPARVREQLRGVGQVFASPMFWRIAPWTVTIQATFLSVQSLWVGPWLRDVAGLPRDVVADHLALIAMAMIAGFIVMGTLAERLSRLGIRPMRVAAAGMTAFMLLLAILVGQWTRGALAVWMLFGFFGTSGILPYAVLSQSFPPQLAGRVVTGLNLIVFLAAFAAQWGIGALIDLWPKTAAGGYAPAGYRAALGVMFALQATGMIWFVLASKWARKADT